MTYSECYKINIERLKEAGITEAESDVRLMFYYALSIDRGRLFMLGNDVMPEEDIHKIHEMAELRIRRIPLQHITGVQEFMGLEFNVTKDVLIPRFDTETLVEEAMLVTPDGAKVLDMCTGSGCILISLMKYKNDIVGVGCDISSAALSVANGNAQKLISEENISFIESDLFENITDKAFDVILSNPPYIKDEVIKTLMPEVREHDPYIALSGGDDGLFFYRKIIAEAKHYMKNGGHLLVEIGNDQGQEVYNLYVQNGYTDVKIVKDLARNDRVVVGRYYV